VLVVSMWCGIHGGVKVEEVPERRAWRMIVPSGTGIFASLVGRRWEEGEEGEEGKEGFVFVDEEFCGVNG
jgi:hypothetical protein